jgi:hypothetical protein
MKKRREIQYYISSESENDGSAERGGIDRMEAGKKG